MKKKIIELNKKLFVGREIISTLNLEGIQGGGLTDPTTPCGICNPTRTPYCQPSSNCPSDPRNTLCGSNC